MKSQVFDQAQAQADLPDGPGRVGVWIVTAARFLVDEAHRSRVRSLRSTSPGVDVKAIPAVSRLNLWPSKPVASMLRSRRFSGVPVVFHCRGEKALLWAARLRSSGSSVALVLDVRGAWPIELLFHRGVDDPREARGQLRRDYEFAMEQVARAVAAADVVTTVSGPLRDWLISECGAPEDTAVIPCATRLIPDGTARTHYRSAWGLGSALTFAYAGTVKTYQHLGDLVLPFLRTMLVRHTDTHALLLSPNLKEMRKLVDAAGLPMDRVILDSLPQDKVVEALTAADAGMLLRAPSLLNRFSQPTKFAEYLASGTPVVAEYGTGVLPEIFAETGVGIAVRTAGEDHVKLASEVDRVYGWLCENGENASKCARDLADKAFSWSSLSPRIQTLYSRALARA